MLNSMARVLPTSGMGMTTQVRGGEEPEHDEDPVLALEAGLADKEQPLAMMNADAIGSILSFLTVHELLVLRATNASLEAHITRRPTVASCLDAGRRRKLAHREARRLCAWHGLFLLCNGYLPVLMGGLACCLSGVILGLKLDGHIPFQRLSFVAVFSPLIAYGWLLWISALFCVWRVQALSTCSVASAWTTFPRHGLPPQLFVHVLILSTMGHLLLKGEEEAPAARRQARRNARYCALIVLCIPAQMLVLARKLDAVGTDGFLERIPWLLALLPACLKVALWLYIPFRCSCGKPCACEGMDAAQLWRSGLNTAFMILFVVLPVVLVADDLVDLPPSGYLLPFIVASGVTSLAACLFIVMLPCIGEMKHFLHALSLLAVAAPWLSTAILVMMRMEGRLTIAFSTILLPINMFWAGVFLKDVVATLANLLGAPRARKRCTFCCTL